LGKTLDDECTAVVLEEDEEDDADMTNVKKRMN
jgi:hypothetical protein